MNSMTTVANSTTPLTAGASDLIVANYKGVVVSVYHSEKDEILLTRQDLIDIANVSSTSSFYINLGRLRFLE